MQIENRRQHADRRGGRRFAPRAAAIAAALIATFAQVALAEDFEGRLSRVDAAIAVVADVQNTLVANGLLRFAGKDLKQRILPRMASGTVASYALSEAGSGSDAFALAAAAG